VLGSERQTNFKADVLETAKADTDRTLQPVSKAHGSNWKLE
jgi:hypothetical protein